jgi:cobyrinic acid a,c-diamide synthase
MYLARTLNRNGQSFKMVGAIPGDVVMHERPVGRGYVNLEETADFPWPAAPACGPAVRAHEFHYSSLENLPADIPCAYTVKRGHGIDGRRDGVLIHNVLASYAHLRNAGGNAWAARFVDFVRHADYRRSRQDNILYLPPARGREAMVI